MPARLPEAMSVARRATSVGVCLGAQRRDRQQADLPRSVGVDAFTAQEQVHGGRLAHRRREALGAAETRDAADPRLRQPELASVGRDHQVAGEGELEPTAEGEAVDRSDDGHVRRGDRRHRAVTRADELLRLLDVESSDLVEVRASAERSVSGALDDDASDRARHAVRRRWSRASRREHFGVQCVELLRAGELDVRARGRREMSRSRNPYNLPVSQSIDRLFVQADLRQDLAPVLTPQRGRHPRLPVLRDPTPAATGRRRRGTPRRRGARSRRWRARATTCGSETTSDRKLIGAHGTPTSWSSFRAWPDGMASSFSWISSTTSRRCARRPALVLSSSRCARWSRPSAAQARCQWLSLPSATTMVRSAVRIDW